jgi:steroid delta-isomerase-like uncharacterized protein
MTDDNKSIRRRYHEAWNAGDSDALDSIMAPEVVNHSPLQGQAEGVEGFKQAIQWMRAGVPDLAITIDSSVSEGDRVATQWTGSGTQTGNLMGIPPTGKTVTVSGIDICRIADGRIVEYWQVLDTFGMLQQLGAIPAPQEAAGASA